MFAGQPFFWRFGKNIMASVVRELSADPARWSRKRSLKPKGKRKAAKRGGVVKRKRRKFNMKNLTGASKPCVCHSKCICGQPIVVHDGEVQTDPLLTAVKMVHKATSIEEHTNLLPKAGTITKSDRRHEQCGAALNRLKRAIPVGYHWSSVMIVVCLRLVFNGVYNFNWGWTRAVHFASESVNLRQSTVFRYANDYLDPDNADIIWPRETQMKMRGRGSEAFINNHGRDKYSALKEVLVFFTLFVCTQHHPAHNMHPVTRRNT